MRMEMIGTLDMKIKRYIKQRAKEVTERLSSPDGNWTSREAGI